jgi:hypothetical protein
MEGIMGENCSCFCPDMIRRAVEKSKLKSVQAPAGEYKMIVHPLRYMEAERGISPLLNWPLPPYANELQEQTEADYYGWGINPS